MADNFDPYLDWDKVDQEVTDDLYDALASYERDRETFLKNKTIDNAKKVLRSHNAITEVSIAVHDYIYTIPVMVHEAGTKKRELDPDYPEEGEVTVQRCKRCGSILHAWREGVGVMTNDGPKEISEDDIPWWDVGDIVAKATGPEGAIGMYLIDPDHQLEKHEMKCVSLVDLVGK